MLSPPCHRLSPLLSPPKVTVSLGCHRCHRLRERDKTSLFLLGRRTSDDGVLHPNRNHPQSKW